MLVFKRNLNRLIFLVSGFPLAVAAVVFSLFQFWGKYSDQVYDLHLKTEGMAEVFAPLMVNRQYDAIDEVLEYFLFESNQEGVYIYSNSDMLSYKQVEERVEEDYPHPQGGAGAVFHGRYVSFHHPIQWQGTQIGEIVLNADLRDVYVSLIQTILVGVVIITLAFAFAYSLAMRFQKRLNAGVETITRVAVDGVTGRGFALEQKLEQDAADLGELEEAVYLLVRKLSESNSELRESTKYYQSLLNHVVDVIFVVDVDGRIQYVNSQVKHRLGFDQLSLIGRRLSEIIELEDEALAQFYARLRSSQQSIIEADLKHLDGSTRRLELRVSNQIDNPSIHATVIGCYDVTAKSLLEEEVDWKSQLLDAVFENIPEMVYLKDAKEQRYVRVNQAMEHLLGWHREELVGRRDEEVFPQAYADSIRLSDEQALFRGGVVEHPGFLYPTRGGEKRLINKRVIGIIHEQDEVKYILVTGAEAANGRDILCHLHTSAKMLREVLENVDVPIFVHDHDGRIIEVNQKGCHLLGYETEELADLSMVDVIEGLDLDAVQPWWKRLIPGGIALLRYDFTHKDGRLIPVELRLSVIHDEGRRLYIASAQIATSDLP